MNFELKLFIKSDLHRQWFLLNGEDGKFPTGIKLWIGCFSPRFLPVFFCRLAHYFYIKDILFAAKLISLLNFFFFGIEIALKCRIGPGLFLPHTQGTVIGAWEIGKNATIFQGVTLGAPELDFSYQKSSRPTLLDNVTVGSGAKVLGGLTLGSNARVGANAVVLIDVPAQCLAVGVPAKIYEK
jgi:serine O-acetyltransferase